nr:hypothetical protein CFP56_31836 [Quercus suber]
MIGIPHWPYHDVRDFCHRREAVWLGDVAGLSVLEPLAIRAMSMTVSSRGYNPAPTSHGIGPDLRRYWVHHTAIQVLNGALLEARTRHIAITVTRSQVFCDMSIQTNGGIPEVRLSKASAVDPHRTHPQTTEAPSNSPSDSTLMNVFGCAWSGVLLPPRQLDFHLSTFSVLLEPRSGFRYRANCYITTHFSDCSSVSTASALPPPDMSRYERRYDDRDSDVYSRPTRRYRDDDELEIDIQRSRHQEPRRAETTFQERDTVVSDRRDRGPRMPDFLREDHGRPSHGGTMVLREERREDDTYSRAPTRRRSQETIRGSRAPDRVEEEKITIRERDRERPRPPYPTSEVSEKDEIIFRERTRSRPPPPRQRGSEEEIDIKITRRDESRAPPPRSEAPSRSDFKERDLEEIRFRRGPGEASRPPPSRANEVDREEIIIREDRRASPPRSAYRGREILKEEIDIRERSVPPPRQRSQSRGALIAREREEWVVRKRPPPPSPPPARDFEREEIIIRRKERSPSPSPPPPPVQEKEEIIIRRRRSSPSPPPPPPAEEKEEIIIRRSRSSPSPGPPRGRDVETEQIVIRRKERTPSPEPPPREPTPPPQPIYRPPIIQEYITHHRHIDHGFERARSPTPPPPPSPPSPAREDNLEIEIRRSGTRNGKAFEEDIIIDEERRVGGRAEKEVIKRDVSRPRPFSVAPRRRSPSPVRTRYEDDVAAEADYYNRKVTSRGYPGEAYNGATRDWSLLDLPPGTERVRMDGIGGGSQEVSWERYNGNRRSKFITGDRAYESEYGNGLPAPAPPPPRDDRIEETKITERRITESTSRGKTRDKMWTEITKDLVIKEAIEEMRYEYEENDDFFYVIQYLKYEDVLRLVELTEDIRRERRERIREIQWEREELERVPKLLPAPPPAPIPPPLPRSRYDERIYEREYVYDRDNRRYR